MPIAIRFANEYVFQRHFHDHAAELGITSKEEYLNKAKALLEANLEENLDILECVNKSGDILRFNQTTHEFAVVSNIGIIRTYFKPRPHTSGIPSYLTHPHSNNITFFRKECGK